MPPFKCSSCSFTSKTHLALVRHMGGKHKLVKRFLIEGGYEKQQAAAATTAGPVASRHASQDSNNTSYYSYTNNQQWVMSNY